MALPRALVATGTGMFTTKRERMKSSSKNRYWLGFDLGGTKMMATVFDKDFNIVAYRRKKTKDGKGSKAVLGRIVETVEEALQAAHLAHRPLSAIAIASPACL